MLSTLVNSPSVGQDYLSSPEKQPFDDENEKPENVIKAVAAGNFEHHANANYRAMDDLWEVLVNKVFSNEEILNCLLRFLPDKELRRFSQTNSKIYCVSQPIISFRTETQKLLDALYDKLIKWNDCIGRSDSEYIATAKAHYQNSNSYPEGMYERNDLKRNAIAILLLADAKSFTINGEYNDDSLHSILQMHPCIYEDKPLLHMMFEFFNPVKMWCTKDQAYVFAFLEAWKIGHIKPIEIFMKLGKEEPDLIQLFADAVRQNQTLEELTLTLEKFDDFSCLKDLFQALQDDRKIEFITIHAGKKAYFFDSSTKRDLDSYCEILNDPETYHSITIAKQKLKDLGEWASNVFDSFK